MRFYNPELVHIYTPFEGNAIFERTTEDIFIKSSDGPSFKFDYREWDVVIELIKKVKDDE